MILNSPTISGSLTVTGNIITSGSITISGSIASASYATNAELLDGLDSTVFTLTSSFNTTSASLYTVSSSAYVTSGSLSATSGSLSAASGSLSATSGSLSAASGSFNTRVSALEATGSALSSSLLTVSGSGYATSASLSAASGSFDSRVATIESKYATTGSNTFIGTQVVSGSILQSGSFTSTGTLTAQTLVVQTVTSSVVYSSGSNVFGNSLGNSQVFTGSVLITGSLTIAGASNATSYSGTTIYGSTAVCSAVGKFTSCIDAGSGTFSGVLTFPANSKMEGSGVPNFILASTSVVGSGVGPYQTFKTNNSDFGYIGSRDALLSTTGNMLSLLGLNGLSFHTGASYTERFSIAATGIATFACQVCSPNHIASSTCSTAGLRVYGASGTHQWDMYLNGANLRFSDNTSGGCLVVDSLSTFSSTITAVDINIKTSDPSITLTPNSGTYAFFQKLSTANGDYLRLYDGTAYSMRFINGNVGINVVPTENLTIYGAVIRLEGAAGVSPFAIANNNSSGFRIYDYTAGVNRMIITCAGNIGINCSAPSYKLHVGGTIGGYFAADGDNIASFINTASTYTYGVGGVFIGSSTANNCTNLSGGSGALIIRNGASTYTAAIAYNGQAYFCGNVGIGSASPTNILEIVKAQAATTTLYIENSNDQANAATEIRLVGNEGIAPLKNNIQISFVRGSGGCDWALGMPANCNDFVIAGGTNQGDGKPSLGTAERMRIASGGNVLIGTTTDNGYRVAIRMNTTSDTGGGILIQNSADAISHYIFTATNSVMNTQDASIWMRKNGATGRSINAAGTINASGTDYAEYMLKAITDNIQKGDIVGVDSNGKLTNIFANSISFVVKSTDPSYVGGDTWFNIEPLLESNFDTKEDYDIAYNEYKLQLEDARQKVDRIAFSGQVPCNVTGANVGDYIIPIQLENGKIGGQAVTNPTFEQYQISVGKVWKIMENDRAWIAVKIG